MADLQGFERAAPAQLAAREARRQRSSRRSTGRRPLSTRPSPGSSRTCATRPPFAPPGRSRGALQALIRFYETGDDSDREAFDIAWVQNHDTAVDTMNGFIEVYMDARGMKGAWEGVVYYSNHEKTGKIRALAEHAQWFEDHLPVDPRYRKPMVQGVSAQAIEVVVETGDSGPITPIGVNLPNDQRIREKYGSKSVSLSNVLEAYEKLACPTASARSSPGTMRRWSRAREWAAFAGELTTEIHEVLGHGSGRMAEQ